MMNVQIIGCDEDPTWPLEYTTSTLSTNIPL